MKHYDFPKMLLLSRQREAEAAGSQPRRKRTFTLSNQLIADLEIYCIKNKKPHRVNEVAEEALRRFLDIEATAPIDYP